MSQSMYRDLITGLTREYHHVKKNTGDEDDDYEPTMVIYRERLKGRSFKIPLSALWKYIDPQDNRDPRVIAADADEFSKLMATCDFKERTAATKQQVLASRFMHRAIEFAGFLNKTDRILCCTGYNLFLCMNLLEICPKGLLRPAAAQLLMWIQDGLDYLQKMPDKEPDEQMVVGEVTVWNGSTKLGTKDVTVSETELMEGDVD